MGAPERRGPLEHVWKAVLKKGAANQDLRKVKGHATNEDVEAGISTAVDKIGNDKSDANVGEGVEKIKAKGLIVLGKWIVESHDRCKKLMGRIQKMIAVINFAEKTEREKDEKIQKAILGHGPKVWLQIDAQIRDMGQLDQVYSRRALPPPVKGKHK